MFSLICLSYLLAGYLNSFFEGILGKEAQARLEAPLVEELLKPLGFVVLAEVWLWANRARKVSVDWLKSIKVCYVIGYISGLFFGVLENLLSYKNFSRRVANPFSHALGTSIVCMGIYYVLTRGKGGLGRLAFAYSIAFLLHFMWNNFSEFRAVLGGFEITIGIAALFFSLSYMWEVKLPSKIPFRNSNP